jgi:hypothetical protein
MREDEILLVQSAESPRNPAEALRIMTLDSRATVLFRPVGPQELALIQKLRFLEFPSRLEGQPYFYPVLNEEYAIQIARDWNAKNPTIGGGFVTRFHVRTEYLSRFDVKTVGSAMH